MLTLPHEGKREKVRAVMEERREDFRKILEGTKLTADRLGYFTRSDYKNKSSQKYVNIIYLDLKEDGEYEKVKEAVDYLIRSLMKEDVIANEELKSMNIEYDHQSGLFKTKKLHITLFRCKGLYENETFLERFEHVVENYMGKMLECDWMDISTRFAYDETKFYQPLHRIPLDGKLK